MFGGNGYSMEQCVKKTLQHEVGHVFLLKHPGSVYSAHSVMQQGTPNSSTISPNVTSSDHSNIASKWGMNKWFV